MSLLDEGTKDESAADNAADNAATAAAGDNTAADNAAADNAAADNAAGDSENTISFKADMSEEETRKLDELLKEKGYGKSVEIPETADAYEIARNTELPDALLNSEQMTEFTKTFHELGLTQAQVSGIMSKYDQQSLDMFNGFNAESEASAQAAGDELRTEFGDKFNNVIDNCNTVLANFDKSGALADSTLANDPNFIRFLNKIAPALSENRQVGASEGSGGSEALTAQTFFNNSNHN